jgi:ParB family chromosome partitioning protein
MKSIVSIDPFRCRMWEFHDRLEHHIDEITCRSEIESVLKHGQLVPSLGRKLRDDPEHDVELIYGSRRLFVARHLNRPLLVELRQINDAEGIIAMDIENRHRLDISPYERGLSYLRWLRSGFFKSQDDIARALKVSPSQVSRLLKLAALPSVIIGAFRSPTDICEAWALDLAAALDDPQRRSRTCARARVIATLETRPAAREIYRQLLSAAVTGRKVRTPSHDEIVCGKTGKPLFRIRHQSNAVVLMMPIDQVSAAALDRVRARSYRGARE